MLVLGASAVLLSGCNLQSDSQRLLDTEQGDADRLSAEFAFFGGDLSSTRLAASTDTVDLYLARAGDDVCLIVVGTDGDATGAAATCSQAASMEITANTLGTYRLGAKDVTSDEFSWESLDNDVFVRATR